MSGCHHHSLIAKKAGGYMLPVLLRKNKKVKYISYVYPTFTQILACTEGRVSPKHIENNKLADHYFPAG